MRGGCFRSGGCSAAFPDDNGLRLRDVSCQVIEPASFLDSLQVGDDDCSIRVFTEILEKIDRIQVRFVSAADGFAESDSVLTGDQREKIGEGTALGYDADRAAFHRGSHWIGESRRRAVDSQAIWADDSGTRVPCDLHDLSNLFLTPVTHAARDDGDPLHPALRTFLHRILHRLGRGEHQGEVDRLWDVAYRGIGRDPEDLCFSRIDWIEPLEACLQETLHEQPSDLARATRCTNQGNGSGMEDWVQLRRSISHDRVTPSKWRLAAELARGQHRDRHGVFLSACFAQIAGSS